MRIKRIYQSSKGLSHEYFVDENDVKEIANIFGIDKNLQGKLAEYLKGKEGVFISEKKLLLINNLPFDITLIKEDEVKDLANSGYNTQIEAIGLVPNKKTKKSKK